MVHGYSAPRQWQGFSGRRAACLAALPDAGCAGRGRGMKHYRVNKLARRGGEIVKKKDMLANDDAQALRAARNDDDCPVCEVWHAGEKVGSIT